MSISAIRFSFFAHSDLLHLDNVSIDGWDIDESEVQWDTNGIVLEGFDLVGLIVLALQEFEIKWDAVESLDFDELISLFLTFDGDQSEVEWDLNGSVQLDFLWVLIIIAIIVVKLDEGRMVWNSVVGGVNCLITPVLELVSFDDGGLTLGSSDISGLKKGGVVWNSSIGGINSFVTPSLKFVGLDDSGFALSSSEWALIGSVVSHLHEG